MFDPFDHYAACWVPLILKCRSLRINFDASHCCSLLLAADCMSKILQNEGLVALWAGTVPSVVLAGNPAVQFMVYEALKRYLQGALRTQVMYCLCQVSYKGLVINYGEGGLQNGKIAGPKLFASPLKTG